MYKTVVIEYSPKADNMAEKIEEKANEMISRAELLAKEIRLGSIEYAELSLIHI